MTTPVVLPHPRGDRSLACPRCGYWPVMQDFNQPYDAFGPALFICGNHNCHWYGTLLDELN